MQKTSTQELEYSQEREKHMVEIRKKHRDEIMNKRRQVAPQGLELSAKFIELKESSLTPEYVQFNAKEFGIEQLPLLVQCLLQNDIIQVLFGAIGIRKLLCMQNPPIQKIIDLGAVHRLVGLLRTVQYPYLQLEAAWILTNIISGTTAQCFSVLSKGALNPFIDLLSSKYAVVAQQAVWAIANIGADNARNRDQLINRGVLGLLIRIAEESEQQFLINKTIWAITILCRGKPAPSFKVVRESLAMLCQIIRSVEPEMHDLEILTHCCTAISYHCHTGTECRLYERLDFFASENIMSRLISYLSCTDELAVPGLRILGNFSTGRDSHTQMLLDENILIYLLMLLGSELLTLRKNTCWMLGNIVAGARQHAETVFFEEEIINTVLVMLQTDQQPVQKDIVVMLGNLAMGIDREILLSWLREKSVIRILVNLIQKTKNVSLLEEILNTIERFLEVGLGNGEKRNNPIGTELYQFNGIDILEKLQTHPSGKVFELVSFILSSYFELNEEEY